MRKPLALLTAVSAAAALAVPALGATTKTVRVDDDYFVKDGAIPTVTVKKGTTVKWVWRGDVVHNVVVEKGPVKFSSRTQSKGTFKRVMKKKGLYSIVCTIHPGMAMKLRVK
jgi:plastocyanin